MVLQGLGPGLGHNIHSCPASSPAPPLAAVHPLSIFTRMAGASSANQLLGKLCQSASMWTTWIHYWASGVNQLLGEQIEQAKVRGSSFNSSWEPFFLVKSLLFKPSILNKCPAFHTAQLSNQTGDYLGKGMKRSNSSPFSRYHQAPQFFW